MAQGISLHIGLNEVNPLAYDGQWQGKLMGAVADAQDMYAIAQAQGFQARLLLNEQSTRSNLLAVLTEASRSLVAGDMFFLSFAGHGGKLPDLSGDESDGIDETWCLYDGQFLDDELTLAWLQYAQDVRILVVSDSCYSGTITRGQAGVPRAMPRQVARATWRQQQEFYRQIKIALPKTEWGELPLNSRDDVVNTPLLNSLAPKNTGVTSRTRPKATVRLLAACAEGQMALDGKENGLFTKTLKAVWKNGRFSGNYASFYNQLYQLLQSQQTPQYTGLGAEDRSFDAKRPFQI